MQRTVKSTKATIITATGETLVEEIFNNTDSKSVLKTLEKKHGRGKFMIVDEEITENLYILDDEIFFKYAVKKTDIVEG